MNLGKKSEKMDYKPTPQIDNNGAGISDNDQIDNLTDIEIQKMVESLDTEDIKEKDITNAYQRLKKNLVQNTFNEEETQLTPSNLFSETCGYDPLTCPFEQTDCHCRAYIGSIIDDFAKHKDLETS